MLSADDVLGARFPVTSFREGYDQAQVDAFLDRAARTLRERATRPRGRDDVTADEVERLVLRTRTLVQGYETTAVDELLERLRVTLATPPSPALPSSSPSRPATPTPPSPGPARPHPAPAAPLGRRIADALEALVVGLPPLRPPRTVRPPRARRVRAGRVQVTPTGITWTSPWRGGGHLAAGDVAEVVELVLSYPKGGDATYHLVVDHSGVARLRVHAWGRPPARRLWTPLAPGVRVTTADPLMDRAKDARRTWPEAFSRTHAYPLVTAAAVIAVWVGVVVPVLEVLGVE